MEESEEDDQPKEEPKWVIENIFVLPQKNNITKYIEEVGNDREKILCEFTN